MLLFPAEFIEFYLSNLILFFNLLFSRAKWAHLLSTWYNSFYNFLQFLHLFVRDIFDALFFSFFNPPLFPDDMCWECHLLFVFGTELRDIFLPPILQLIFLYECVVDFTILPLRELLWLNALECLSESWSFRLWMI